MRETRRCSPCGDRRKLELYGRVLAVVTDLGGKVVKVIPGTNLVTNDGDLYYAQRAVEDTPTDDFTAGGLRLGTGTTTPAKADTDVTTFVASSGRGEYTGYPKVNDTHANNSGGGTDIVTWMYQYTAGYFTGTGIIEGAIVDNVATPTAALCHFLFAASFNIVATEALSVFINHEFLGA